MRDYEIIAAANLVEEGLGRLKSALMIYGLHSQSPAEAYTIERLVTLAHRSIEAAATILSKSTSDSKEGR